ncbi:MAG: AMP-binding protein [Acidimicrobiales bacterium]
MNLAAVLEARASDEVAFLVGDRSFTHAEVHDGAARMASLLVELGVCRGDRVLIVLPDGIEFVWAFLGAIRLGAIAVPVNPRLPAADHAALAADADPRVVIGEDDAERLEARLAAYRSHPPVAVDARDPAYAQYTSGTTGQPKGALHGHGDPLVYFDAFARGAIAVTRNDVVLSVSKLYFAYGLGNALFFPLLSGCRAVLHAPHPQPDAIAALIDRHGVTVLFAVPTFYAHLVAGGAAPSTLRVAVSAGEPLIPELAARARALLGCPILDGIGSTEVGQTFASNTLDRWRDGSVGRALPPYRIRVQDGELWVAGPTVLLGYLGPSTPPPTMDGEWLSTGDRAEIDDEGDLVLRGRADDMELVAGMCVSPLEVEAVLLRHPAVAEVAVAGAIDAAGASALHAFAVLAPGGSVNEAELLAWGRADLAPFKVPRTVTFVDALPRTPTGKLRRFALRRQAHGGVS